MRTERLRSRDAAAAHGGEAHGGRVHGGGVTPWPLFVGREAERTQLADLLAAARAGVAGAALISGEAGRGKTALLRQVCLRARGAGFTVLAATGLEFERTTAFGALRALLSPLGPRTAGPALEPGREGEGEGRSSPVAVYRRVLDTVSAAASEGPVLVAVDDAHWLDPESLDALLFLTDRLRVDPVLVLLAARPGGALDRRRGLERLVLGEIGAEEAARLLAARGVQGPVARACHAQLGGNPLALIEAAAALSVGARRGAEPLPARLPIGPRLLDHYDRLLAPLPPATRAALVVASVEGTGQLAAIGAAVRRLGGRDEALAPAEAAGLVERRGSLLVWTHPVARSAAYHLARPDLRRRAHAALAADDLGLLRPEQVAWHLAHGAVGPDDAVAERLAETGRLFVRRGALRSAAEAFERAAGLSTAPARAVERLVLAADARWATGDHHGALATLDPVLGTIDDPVLAARAALVHAGCEMYAVGPHVAGRRLTVHGRAVAGTDPALAMMLLFQATVARLLLLDTGGAAELARAAWDRATASGDPVAADAGEALVVVADALDGADAADAADASGPAPGAAPAPGVAPADGGAGDRTRSPAAAQELALARLDSGAPGVDALVQLGGLARLAAGDSQGALDGFDEFIAVVERDRPSGRAALARLLRAEALWRLGRWPDALGEASAAVSFERARGTGPTGPTAPFAHAMLARIEAGLGRVPRCREHAEAALQLAAPRQLRILEAWALASLVLLALGDDEPAEAVADAEALVRVAGAVGAPGLLWFQVDAVEVLLRTGARDDAEALADRLRRRAGAHASGWARSAAARCDALLGRRDPEEALADALVALRQGTAPFEEGRTLLARGRARLQAGDDTRARRDLDRAAGIFDRLGAAAWRQQVTALVGDGPAPSALSAVLTAAELRVALVVGRGATNRDAAESLFLSVKTVDSHLQSIYRKLGVHNRAQLAAVVASSAG